MNNLSGTIALSVSFVLFIYLGGLKMSYSSQYDPGFFFFPVILLFISFAFFGMEFIKFNNKQ
ncbi:hypothetical protein [Psychrobacillus sp.]|uniref:hypothetical protein n=1 Tax=Psychrobacillus sp. TaxID=1871623 RepID=UPI0028BD9E5C|nr:hypothetical protein [Psychrobacillus sp.]